VSRHRPPLHTLCDACVAEDWDACARGSANLISPCCTPHLRGGEKSRFQGRDRRTPPVSDGGPQAEHDAQPPDDVPNRKRATGASLKGVEL